MELKINELGKIDIVKRAVLLFMKANGSENTSSISHLSVNEILKDKFDVGTEKPKSFGYPDPKDEELMPLRLMDITSDNKKAKEKLKLLQVEKDNGEDNSGLMLVDDRRDLTSKSDEDPDSGNINESDNVEIILPSTADEDLDSDSKHEGNISDSDVDESDNVEILPPGWESKVY